MVEVCTLILSERPPHGQSGSYFGAFAHSLDEVPVVLADLVILSWPEFLACPPRVKFALLVAV